MTPGGRVLGRAVESKSAPTPAVTVIQARKGCFIKSHPSALWDELGRTSLVENVWGFSKLI